MNILAIWERPESHPQYGGIFLLCNDERLLHCTQEKIYCGYDVEGKRMYRETGAPEYSNAFNESDRFDFRKADFFLHHFGGQCVWKEV